MTYPKFQPQPEYHGYQLFHGGTTIGSTGRVASNAGRYVATPTTGLPPRSRLPVPPRNAGPAPDPLPEAGEPDLVAALPDDDVVEPATRASLPDLDPADPFDVDPAGLVR